MTNHYRVELERVIDAHDADEGMSVSRWTANLTAAIARARALLAQPEPEGPSEDELIEYWYEDCEGEGDKGILRFARYIRRTNHPEENK